MSDSKIAIGNKQITDARMGEHDVTRIYLGEDLIYRNYSFYDTYMIYNGNRSGTITFNVFSGKGTYSINGVKTTSATFEHGTELGLVGLKPTILSDTDYQTIYDYSNWSIKKFTVPANMKNFQGMCAYFPKDSNLDELRTDNATDFTYMFRECEMESMNLSHFVTDNVIYMTWTFQYCRNLKELNISTWNTSNVINTQNMFAYCESLKELNLTSFDTSNIKHYEQMFKGVSDCTIYISDKWTLGTESDFAGGTNLTFITI